MGLLRRWARAVLADELAGLNQERQQLHAERTQARQEASENAGGRTYWQRRALQAEEDARYQHRAANGQALLRLERELLNAWDRLATGVERPISVDEHGDRVCTKVELHSLAEARRFAGKLKRETYYPHELESYPCHVCRPHPVVGRVFHLRHVNRRLRGMVHSEYNQERAAQPLSVDLHERLTPTAREKLAALLANDNGPADWTPDEAVNVPADATRPERPTAPDGTAIMPAVGTVDVDGTIDEERS